MHKGHTEIEITLKKDILTLVQESDQNGISLKELVIKPGEDEGLILEVLHVLKEENLTCVKIDAACRFSVEVA